MARSETRLPWRALVVKGVDTAMPFEIEKLWTVYAYEVKPWADGQFHGAGATACRTPCVSTSRFTRRRARSCARTHGANKWATFFAIWAESGHVTPFAFSDSDYAGWREPAEFTELVATIVRADAARQFANLRAMVPKGNGRT